MEKRLSRTEKEADKKSNQTVLVYNLQPVLPCTSGKAYSFYYVSKLNVYKFNISHLNGDNVSCYVWHETEAHRGATEIGSCILHYLGIVDPEAAKSDKPIDVIFYSDNCAGQNKNQHICILLLSSIKIKIPQFYNAQIFDYSRSMQRNKQLAHALQAVEQDGMTVATGE